MILPVGDPNIEIKPEVKEIIKKLMTLKCLNCGVATYFKNPKLPLCPPCRRVYIEGLRK